MNRNLFPLIVLLVLPVLLCGCGRHPRPVGVSGVVTFDGQPVAEGNVLLEPLSGSEGQRRDATITDGKFALPAQQGVLPGLDFKVVIKGFRKTGNKYPNADPSASADEYVQYIPEKYNAASELRVTISAEEEQNRFEFNLTSASQ